MSAIPLADAGRLRPQARRTLAVRLGLAGLAVACLIGAITLSRDAGGTRRTFFADARSSVVVIDISGSIGPKSRSLIGRTLRKLLDAHSSFGLVFFSDTAYEAVPPGTKWTELEPLLRYFQPPDPRQVRATDTPWAEFRGGTRISTGLQLARSMLAPDRSGGVLLLSDLDNSIFDAPALTQTLAQYVGDRIPLRVIGLAATRADQEVYRRVLGPSSIVSDAELPAPQAAGRSALVTTSSGASTALTLAALVLLLLLGAHEHWAARLRWREAAA